MEDVYSDGQVGHNRQSSNEERFHDPSSGEQGPGETTLTKSKSPLNLGVLNSSTFQPQLQQPLPSLSKFQIKLKIDSSTGDVLLNIMPLDDSSEGSLQESDIWTRELEEDDQDTGSDTSSESANSPTSDPDDESLITDSRSKPSHPPPPSSNSRNSSKLKPKRLSRKNRSAGNSGLTERMENIVSALEKSWTGGEDWFGSGLIEISRLYCELRADSQELTLGTSDYYQKLANFYYRLSTYLQDMQKSKEGETFNLRSIETALNTSLSNIVAIPDEEHTESLKLMKVQVENRLRDTTSMRSMLEKIPDSGPELSKTSPKKYAKLSILLGRVMNHRFLTQQLDKCSAEARPSLEKQVRSIQLLQAVLTLEDALTAPPANNLLDAASHWFILSKAYTLVGSPTLESTSMRCFESGESLIANLTSEPRSSDHDPWQTIEKVNEIVRSCVENHENIANVKLAIQKHVGFTLRNLDSAHVESKYIEICSQLWLEQVSAFLKKIIEEKKLDLVLNIFEKLGDISQLQSSFAHLKYYHLLQAHSAILSKQAAHKTALDLKQLVYASLSLYTSWARRELDFIHAFSELLCSFKSAPDIISALQLKSFIAGTVKLEKLLSNISQLNPSAYGSQITQLQASASSLKNAKDFFLLDKLKKVLEACIAEPEVKPPEILDNRTVVQVLGANMAISTVLGQLENVLRNCHGVEEIRFISSKIIHVDRNLQGELWKGRNIVVGSEKIKVYDSVTWNVSGSCGENKNSSPAGTTSDGSGERGADGQAGKSGGNVLILANIVENSTKWTIISRGGDGSKGQDGGDGRDGKDGVGISKSDLETKFPTLSKNLEHLSLANLKTVKNSLSEMGIHSGNADVWEENYYFAKIIPDVYFEGRNNSQNHVICSLYEGAARRHTLFLHKGSPGEPGKPGGMPGLGGEGGYFGEVEVANLSKTYEAFQLSKVGGRGGNGENGKGGVHGKHGDSGWDIGYTDSYWVSDWTVYGAKRDSKLRIEYYSDEQTGSVWCAYHNKWAKFHSGTVQKFHKSFNDRQTSVPSERERQSQAKASRKKTISQSKIMADYSNRFGNGTENLLSTLRDQIDNSQNKLHALMEKQLEEEHVNVSKEIRFQLQFEAEKAATSSSIIETDPASNVVVRKTVFDKSSSDELVKEFQKDPKPAIFCNSFSRVELNHVQLETVIPILRRQRDAVDEELQALIGSDLEGSKAFDGKKTEAATAQSHKETLLLELFQIGELENLFLRKYCLYTLQEIDRQLPLINTPVVGTPGEISANKAPKYLKETFTSEEAISHPRLGTIAQYLQGDKPESRKQVADFTAQELFQNKSRNYDSDFLSRSNLNQVLGTFVNEEASLPSSNRLVSLYSERNEIFQAEKKQRVHTLLQVLKRQLSHPSNAALLDLWNTSADTPSLRPRLMIELSKDELVSQTYRKYTTALDKSYSWDGLCSESKIHDEFLEHILEKGPLAVCYRELLAYLYETNIRLYIVSQENAELVLADNHNPSGKRKLHLVYTNGKFKQFNLDGEHVAFDQELIRRNAVCAKLFDDLRRLTKREDFDGYLQRKQYLENFNLNLASLTPLDTSVCDGSRVCDDSFINEIAAYFDKKDRFQITKLLGKLTSACIGPQEILYYLHLQFSTQGCRVTLELLYCLVNDVLTSIVDDVCQHHLFCWIVAARSQENWIDELVMWHIERYFKGSIDTKNSVRRNQISAIRNQDILYLLRSKLADSDEPPVDIACLDQAMNMLSEISDFAKLNLAPLPLSEWPYALAETFWTQKLTSLVDWSQQTDRLDDVCYYTLSAENKYGSDRVNELFSILASRRSELNASTVDIMLSNFHLEKWNLTDTALNKLTKCTAIADFLQEMNASFAILGRPRNIEDLVQLLKDSQNTSSKIRTQLPYLQTIVENVKKGQLQQVGVAEAPGITTWAESILSKLRAGSTISDSKPPLDKYEMVEMLRKIDDAICHKRGFRLRDTQKLSILVMLHNQGNTLAQVSTGEGKSLIVVALSIIKVLRGEKIDIITSSSVLAKRDAEENKDIYQLFNISASHNCRENIDDRKIAYSNNAVVYGDLSNFQRDYLLDTFYGKNVRGDRDINKGAVIVDEVDSMLLDKGNNMLYLSHDIPGLDKLESVYIHIWLWINQPDSDFRLDTIKKAVLNDLFDSISRKTLKRLDSRLKPSQLIELWERLVKNQVVDNRGRFIDGIEDSSTFTAALSPGFTQYEHSLRFIFKEVLQRERSIIVPNSLKNFVELHLESWINSALAAFLMKERHDYVVDVDRTGNSADRNPNIIILDKDTGTDQGNSQWDEALHQFLQLKHGCKLSMQSLKAVFISNVSFFKLYRNLYGLTGTLGSSREREMLTKFHNVDFVTIPTAKPKQFDEYPPLLCSNKDDWIDKIKKETLNMFDSKRSVLIICETVDDAEILKAAFGDDNNYLKYTREYEDCEVAKGNTKLDPGKVVIATNLAGRGTDIKLSKDLKNAGGLHVCLAYLPDNIRIEKQAFGRAARSGDKGSGQLIVVSPKGSEYSCTKAIETKKQRDSKEIQRLAETKAYYETQIKTEEGCFSKFRDEYSRLKQALSKSSIPDEAKDIIGSSVLDSWAFWLDQNSKLITNVSHGNNKYQSQLEKSFSDFTSKFATASSELELSQMAHWASDSPIRLIELAKYYCDKANYVSAIDLFDGVIKSEPAFSDAAHYYKAFAVAKKDGFTGVGDASFHVEMGHAERLFNERLTSTRKSGGIVEKLKTHADKNLVQIDAFQEQQQSLSNICNMFMQSINDIYGHPVTPESLVTDIISENLADDLYESLTNANILRAANVSITITPESINAIQLSHVIPADSNRVATILRQKIRYSLTNFLTERAGNPINLDTFENDLRLNIALCNRKDLWNQLLKAKILSDPIKYVVIDLEKWEKYDPESLKSTKSKLESRPKQTLKNCDISKVILNSEQISQLQPKWIVLIEKDLQELISTQDYDKLKKKGVFLFNESASLNREALKAGIQEFPAYDSITLQDFIQAGIEKSEASKLAECLLNQNILQPTSTQDRYKLGDAKLPGFQLLEFPLYVPIVDDLLTVHFAYRLALLKLQAEASADMKTPLSLPFSINPYSQFMMELLSTKLLKPASVNPTYADLKAEIKKVLTGLASEDQITTVVQTLEQSRSIIEFVSTPDCSLVALTDYLKERQFANADELRLFKLNAQDKLIQMAEKKIWWKFYLSLAGVIALAVAQIAIGVLIQIKSVGLMTHVGAGFIQEGISDLIYVAGALYTGDFSWKDYGIQKAISVGITVGTCCIGAFLSRGAKTASTVGQAFLKPGQVVKDMTKWQVARAIGKQIAIQGGKGLALGVINAGADHLIQTQLQGLCTSISSAIMADIAASVAAHKISLTLESAYGTLGEKKARNLISTFINTLTTNNSFGQDWMPLANQIVSGVFQGIQDASARFGSGGGSAILRAGVSIVKICSYLIPLLKGIVSIADVRLVVDRFLNDLDAKIQQELNSATTTTADVSSYANNDNFKRFKADITDEIKRVVSEKAKIIVDQNIVSPIIRQGVDMLSQESARLLRRGFYTYRDTRFDKKFKQAVSNHEKNLANIREADLNKSEIKIKVLNAKREHHLTLLKLWSKVNVNKKLRAKIMKDLKLNQDPSGPALDNKTNDLKERLALLQKPQELKIKIENEINSVNDNQNLANEHQQMAKDVAVAKIPEGALKASVLQQILDGAKEINKHDAKKLPKDVTKKLNASMQKSAKHRKDADKATQQLDTFELIQKLHLPTLEKAVEINEASISNQKPLSDVELIPSVILNVMSHLNIKPGKNMIDYADEIVQTTVASTIKNGRIDLANNFHLAMEFDTTPAGGDAKGSRWGDTERVMSYLVAGFQKMGLKEVNFWQPTKDPKNIDDVRKPHAELQLLAALKARGETLHSVQVSKPPCVCCMKVLDEHKVAYPPMPGAHTGPKNWVQDIQVDPTKTYLMPPKFSSVTTRIFRQPRQVQGTDQQRFSTTAPSTASQADRSSAVTSSIQPILNQELQQGMEYSRNLIRNIYVPLNQGAGQSLARVPSAPNLIMDKGSSSALTLPQLRRHSF